MTSRSRTEQLLQWLAPSSRRTPDTPVDWDDLLAEAVAHTVAPQFFQRLLRAPGVPQTVIQCAMLASSRQKQYVANLGGELKAILQALAAKNITPILLKGAHLALFVYPEPGHRPMADIDLLVRESDLEEANRVLMEIGYAPQYDESIEVAHTHSHALPLLLKPGCIAIELHWTLADPTDAVYADLDGIWDRSIEVGVQGERARVFSAEDLLPHICFHAGVMHNFAEKGLRPLFDVAAIVGHYGASLDWSVVEARARDWRIERSTWLMLELVREYHPNAIPEDVLQRMKPAKVSASVIDAARGQLFERPGVRLQTIRTRQVALALSKPGVLGSYFRDHPVRRAKDVVARYGGFVWDGLRRNRQLLGHVLRKTRRQFILNAWLKKHESAL